MSSLQLLYWPIRGMGAPIRMALTIAGLQFEDVRMGDDYFSEGGVRAKMLETNALANLPALKLEDGRIIVQTYAILRHIARTSARALLGETVADEVNVDQILETLKDFHAERITLSYEDGFSSNKEAFAKDTVPFYFGSIDAFIQANKTTFAASNALTLADLVLFESAEVVRIAYGSLDLLASFPNILRVHKAVQELPALATYHAHTSVTFPLNGKSANFGTSV